MTKKDETTRVGVNFKRELEDIREQRKEKGCNGRVGDRKITTMIPKHECWVDIKKDLIEHEFDEE